LQLFPNVSEDPALFEVNESNPQEETIGDIREDKKQINMSCITINSVALKTAALANGKSQKLLSLFPSVCVLISLFH
jgi:hypothetical protein